MGEKKSFFRVYRAGKKYKKNSKNGSKIKHTKI